VRLIGPGDAVVVQELGALELDVVREARFAGALICLEIVDFSRHLKTE
jgi:hypothetical protein